MEVVGWVLARSERKKTPKSFGFQGQSGLIQEMERASEGEVTECASEGEG